MYKNDVDEYIYWHGQHPPDGLADLNSIEIGTGIIGRGRGNKGKTEGKRGKYEAGR